VRVSETVRTTARTESGAAARCDAVASMEGCTIPGRGPPIAPRLQVGALHHALRPFALAGGSDGRVGACAKK
jgi:hypothetical protein